MKQTCLLLIIAISLILVMVCRELYAQDAMMPPADANGHAETKDKVEEDKGLPVEPRKFYSWDEEKYREPKAYVVNTMDELKQFYLDFSISPNPARAAIEAEEKMKEIDPSHEIFVVVASRQITETCKSPGRMDFRRYPEGVLKARVELRIFEECTPKPTPWRYDTLNLMVFEKPVTGIEATFPIVTFRMPGAKSEEQKSGESK